MSGACGERLRVWACLGAQEHPPKQGGSGWHDSSQDVLEGDSQRQWSLCMSSLETQTPLGEAAGTVCVLGISRGPSGETKKITRRSVAKTSVSIHGGFQCSVGQDLN